MIESITEYFTDRAGERIVVQVVGRSCSVSVIGAEDDKRAHELIEASLSALDKTFGLRNQS